MKTVERVSLEINFGFLTENILRAGLLFCYLAGIVIAAGFWSTAISVFFPPWALYLFTEKLLMIWGLV